MSNLNLRELGLSLNEEKVYEVLVRFGKLSASQISREAMVSYGKIYEVLARLESKNLVRIISEKTKKFIATNPKNLIALVDKKKKELDSIESHLQELKQVYVENKEEPVFVVRGKKSWPKLRDSLKKPKNFAYSIKYNVEYRPTSPRRRQMIKKGIKYKTLVRLSPETKDNIKKWLKLDKEHKVVENDGIAMSITEHELLIVLIKQNISLLIKDSSLTKIMKQMFEALYDRKDYIDKSLLD